MSLESGRRLIVIFWGGVVDVDEVEEIGFVVLFALLFVSVEKYVYLKQMFFVIVV